MKQELVKQAAVKFRAWLLFAALGVLIAVSLSDRAGDGSGSVSGGLGRVDHLLLEGRGISVLSQLIPVGLDTIGHFIAWGLVGLIAADTAQTIEVKANRYVALVALSAVVEVGQHYLSFSRSAQLTDLIANAAGLAVGFTMSEIVRWIGPKALLLR